MLANALTVITSLISAITDFITPTVGSEGSLITAAGVAAIATLFAIPIGTKAIRKAYALIKGV